MLMLRDGHGFGRTGFTPVHAAGDADLVRQARDGDEVAFADLYRRYARMVHGCCLHAYRSTRATIWSSKYESTHRFQSAHWSIVASALGGNP
jgi:hypothetical protein